MSRTVEIDVTQLHIENGTQLDCRECPIALAITDKLGLIAEVTLSQAEVCGTLYKLPHEANNFMRQFDAPNYHNYELEPFSFVMEKIGEYHDH